MKYKISQDRDLVPVVLYYFVIVMSFLGDDNYIENFKSGIFWLGIVPLVIFLITKVVSMREQAKFVEKEGQ